MAIENGVMLQYFEWYLPADATLWKKLASRAPELGAKGVTSVWMPPAYKGQAGIEDTGYGVYDVYDLGEFDQKGTVPTKYGTKKEYLKAIKALQDNGIDAYADIVLNHMMGADETETVDVVETKSDDRMEEISGPETIEAWTKFTFPGRKGKYSDFIWDHTCFNGVDYDARKDKVAIYKFNGKQWNRGVDRENVNYDYLMGANVNYDVPKVREERARWGQWYVDTTHVNGFRLDAVKHISRDFFPEWLGKLRQDNHKEYFAVGEYWNAELDILEDYLNACGKCMSLFDVPLHFHFFEASNSGGEYDMQNLLHGTLVEQDPTLAVTFVDNHDTQTGQALESAIQPWFVPLAYSVILLRPQGYPCVFYGNYYGVIAMNGPSFQREIDILLQIRQERVYGPQHDYFDHPDIVGWTLEGNEEHGSRGVAVILTNRTGGEKTMYVGSQHAGELWFDAMTAQSQEVTIGEDGNAVFSCADGSLSVWIQESDEEWHRRHDVQSEPVTDVSEETEQSAESSSNAGGRTEEEQASERPEGQGPENGENFFRKLFGKIFRKHLGKVLE